MRIDFHPAATAELEESADWYAVRSAAAARGLALAVDAALKKIAHDPNRFTRIDSRHKSCSLERYPEIRFQHPNQSKYGKPVIGILAKNV